MCQPFKQFKALISTPYCPYTSKYMLLIIKHTHFNGICFCWQWHIDSYTFLLNIIEACKYKL